MPHYKKLIFCFLAGIGAASSANPAQASGALLLGLEGFSDHYREPDPAVDVNRHADYGSIIGGYTHTSVNDWFWALDGRISYGKDDYKSTSGSENGIPQYEGEIRFRLGLTEDFGDYGTLNPYTGLGERLFLDDSKGRLTSLGDFSYDRRISQLYLPIGASYKINVYDNWVIAPTLEYDQLLVGYVNSRLSENGGDNLGNTQHNGYGVRGELMFGQQLGTSWQFGPFFRYWNIRSSDTVALTNGTQIAVEPANTRLQIGLKFQLLF